MNIVRRAGLALVVAACVLAALVLGMGSAAHHRTARRAPVARLHQASNDAAARAALQRLLSKHPQTAQLVTRPRLHGPGNLVQLQSTNWAGYADDNSGGGTYSKVSGNWTIRAVSCTPEDQLTSEWVGLDGFNNNTVEQAGTLAWCFQGTAHYYTWYEMFPAGQVTVGTAAHAGDAIAASVSVSGTTYTLKVTDSTTPAESFTRTATCASTTCKRASAEWIAERPSFSIGTAPLAHFTSAYNFSAGKATHSGTAGNINSFPDNQLTMIDATATYNLATDSALNATGTGFSVTWHNSY